MTPKERSRTAGFLKLLVAVVSLKRLVFNNYAVLEAKQTYEIQTMQFEEEDELNLASDSTEGGLDGNESVTNTIDLCLEADIVLPLGNLKKRF